MPPGARSPGGARRKSALFPPRNRRVREQVRGRRSCCLKSETVDESASNAPTIGTPEDTRYAKTCRRVSARILCNAIFLLHCTKKSDIGPRRKDSAQAAAC